MSGMLIYWRDRAADWACEFAGDRAFYWHSSARCIAELQPGDRMWMVTSGKGLRQDAEQACLCACLSRDGLQATHKAGRVSRGLVGRARGDRQPGRCKERSEEAPHLVPERLPFRLTIFRTEGR